MMLVRAALLLSPFALVSACASTGGQAQNAAMSSSVSVSASASALGKVRHVVLFKFKDGSSPAQIQEIVAAFAALPQQIPQIRGFEWGTDMSPEGLQQGLTHAFILTFDSAADRDAYLPHPAHKAFVDVLKPHLDKVTVLDFVAKDRP